MLETAWDLGPFTVTAATLAPGQASSPATKYKKLYETKNNCVHAQVGQIMDKRHKKTEKLLLVRSQEQKAGY